MQGTIALINALTPRRPMSIALRSCFSAWAADFRRAIIATRMLMTGTLSETTAPRFYASKGTTVPVAG